MRLIIQSSVRPFLSLVVLLIFYLVLANPFRQLLIPFVGVHRQVPSASHLALQEEDNKKKIKEAIELSAKQKELDDVHQQMVLVIVGKDWQERDKKLTELQEKEKDALKTVLLIASVHNGETLTPDVIKKIDEEINQKIGKANDDANDDNDSDNRKLFRLMTKKDKDKDDNGRDD